MSDDETPEAMQGRYKHLGQLGLIFYHRHGTWEDFGQFLKGFFSEPMSAGEVPRPPTLTPVVCRHTPGGRHYLGNTMSPKEQSVFAEPRYHRPCVTAGAYDPQKNPGLIVDDVCKKAEAFLRSIGKGEKRKDGSDRDCRYDPRSESEFGEPGSSQVPDSEGSIDVSNIIDSSREIVSPTVNISQGSDPNLDDDLFFENEDVLVELDAICADVAEGIQETHSMGTPSGYHGSDDSVIQSATRSTTKIRAATLAYLWQFADHPLQLRDEFRRVRRNPGLYVLHLCGCGLCWERGGVKYSGCVEKTHLRLGTADENLTHRAFHTVISLATREQYADTVRTVQSLAKGEAPYGAGVF